MIMDDVSISHGFDDPLRWWHVQRLNMFSDALFSIIATIMTVTFKLGDNDMNEDGFLLRSTLIDNLPGFVAYFGCFFVVSTYWGCHVRLYNLVVNSNDVLSWLNLLLLCVISFLPLTLSLWAQTSSYKDYTIHFPSINLALAGLILTITVLYVFRDKASHHTNITASQKNQRRFIILLYAWFPTLIGMMCIYLYKLAELALALVFLLVLLTAAVIAKFEKWYLGHTLLDIAVQQIYRSLPLERIEAFSDGVYAISMTLMAVETAEKLSDMHESDQFLTVFGNACTVYLTAFGLVSVLWFVHHQLCNNIERSNPVIQTLNTLALAYVGGIPFTSSLIQHYVNPHNYGGPNYPINEKVAVQVHCFVLFFSGFFQALMWLAALFMRCAKINYENYSDTLLLFKAMVVPMVSCAVYICSLFSVHSGALFLVLTCTIPFVFSIANYIHRGRICTLVRRLIVRLFGPRGDPVELQNNQGLLEDSDSNYDEDISHHPPLFSYMDRTDTMGVPDLSSDSIQRS